MMADENKEHEEEDELHDDLGLFCADEQFEVIFDELHDDLGGFMDDHIASAVPVANLGECGGPTEQARMKALVRAYQSSALGSDDPVAFWSDTGDGRAFTKMMPGARSLLKFSSGNAKLERVFSHAIQVFCDDRRKNVDIRQLLMLRCNGASAGLPDYRHIW